MKRGPWLAAAAAALFVTLARADGPTGELAVDSVTLELSGVDRVEGGFLVVEDELVGAVLFLDDASLQRGQPHVATSKLERRRKDVEAGQEKLFPIQDFEDLASDGARAVYLLGSHSMRVRRGRWERRPDREFIIQAGWEPADRALSVADGKKQRGRYSKLLDDLVRDHGEAVLHGFNAEGLALRDGRLYVGLRAPLEQGKALVFHATAKEVFGGEPVRWQKLRLELGGGGVRALHWDAGRGELLALSGPALEGVEPAPVLWAADPETGKATELTRPRSSSGGWPEGVCRLDAERLLVVYDAEGARRAPLQTLPLPAKK
ncbi:MAG: DUF3616 domain-containing protein [Planctomycetota bacterium]